MANVEEPGPSQQGSMSFIDEPMKARIEKYMKLLNDFIASDDQVYKFQDNLSGDESNTLRRICHLMGIGVGFNKVGKRRKAYVYKMEGKDSKQIKAAVTVSRKRKNRGEPGPYKKRKFAGIGEFNRIWISQVFEKFSASSDEVYNFEDKLSPEECVAVYELSQKMGLRVEKDGFGFQQKISVHKTGLENLPHFTFSEKSKHVLGSLIMHYPPDDESRGEMIGTNSDAADRAEHKEDDFFSRPYMSKADVIKKLEDLATRMKNSSDLKLITEQRSKLPIASFKDVITSTVESHQVAIICGETGCGKTTQVPQYILDHMWGKGEVCKIVCTQPRCISATSVSERIARERGETIGNNVGYKIPFESRGGRQSSIVLCTARVLLKVLVSNGSNWLKTWSVKDDISSITHIIMDEIHERDRYSDLMLAILRKMLPSNPHLRLILMSATLDATRFSQYFGDCPVIHVQGSTHLVKTYYLEDVLSFVELREHNHLDNNHELSEEEKLSLDEAINLAWSNDEWCPLLEFICSVGSTKVFNYQHSLTGLSPLMVFAGKGKVGDMCVLLYLGANCHLKALDGTTALEIAEKEKQQVAAELLKKHIDNNFSNKEGKKFKIKHFETVNPELIAVFLIERLIKKICIDSKDGGILVFLPGWDEIKRMRDRLLASPFFNDTAKFRVISLHSMVSSIEQKVFMRPPHGWRKIVLSTNIAETAVTIDDIVYVIDTGRLKEKGYDPCDNVVTLQSSWISKASAKHREGRAGRCQRGFCYRLYSKVQAASMPDFQVPEIKRMPIEELCLQVKLLDPSSKIEEFLSQTLDPPGSESIQNAIAVLQRIGALSFDEKLTQLGEKLGSLPVHPLAGRMLLFSILMDCLDPALTLACASEYKDPFTLPILPHEKKRAAAVRSELASLYGGFGDQFAVIAAYECWQNSKKFGLEERFCTQYFVSQSSMHLLSVMRKQLATELFQNGLICDDVSRYCLNAHDPGILHAVLVAGMYPMVGKFLCNEGGKKLIVKTESGDKVGLNRHSTNFKLSSQKSFNCSLVVYDEITRDDWGMSISNCTVVGFLPLLLLSTEIADAPMKYCEDGNKFLSSPGNIVRVIIDRWLDFESTALDVSHMHYLRKQLSAAILYKVTHSKDVLPSILAATKDALACVLSCDGLSGIRQTSGGANRPTAIVNATNLGKTAKGTAQVGKKGEESQTKLVNQHAPKTNPSKVSVTAYQATENPCDRTSENALIGLACSIATGQMDKNPEGYQTELRNHDVMPSSVVSISTSQGVENQSDPMTENTPIGSACIISTENTAKNQEEYRTELINHVAAMTNVPSEENVSASKCIENPSDPISQNTPRERRYKKVAIGWTFPETGWIKANTDGSYKEDGCLLACGGVFRDAKGHWSFGFAQNLGPFFSGVISDEWKDGCKEHYVFLTELWGILTALNLAREKGISQLWIETDSTTSVEFISNTALQRRFRCVPCSSIIQSIVKLMEGNWTVRISVTLREGNQIADWLANYAHSTEVGLHVLDVPPPECITLLTEDVAGLYKYRRRACLEENCTSS